MNSHAYVQKDNLEQRGKGVDSGGSPHLGVEVCCLQPALALLGCVLGMRGEEIKGRWGKGQLCTNGHSKAVETYFAQGDSKGTVVRTAGQSP